MALIETNFIRPQEVYDRNTGESKVRYRSYDGNDRFIPVVEGENGVPKTLVEVTHAELKAMRDAGKLTPGALYRITDYNCTTTQENTQSAGHQFDIVLLALSENKLAEEGWAMMNESNIYDVTFDDGVTKKCYLYEIDRGYNVIDISTLLGYIDDNIEINETNKTAITDNQTDELIIPDLIYNYFQNSNLSAWKVWYCLDNDTSRFAWADDTYKLNPSSIICDCYTGTNVKVDGPIDFSEKQFVNGTIYYRDEENDTIIPHMGNVPAYAWTSENNITIFTLSITPNSFDTTYAYNTRGTLASISGAFGYIYKVTSYIEGLPNYDFPNGRGVIYRMIDEFNNDIKYDFKNIQFKRTITDGQYDANGTETWCYTLNVWYNDMCQDASIVGNTILNDEGYINGVHDNKFGYATAYDLAIEGVDTFAFALGDNAVLSFDDGGYFGIFSNTIGNSFYNNTIGNEFNNNTIGNRFASNTIGVGFNNNTIGNSFINKTISDNTNYKNYGNSGVELATKE